jgi:hypothetical protein
VKYYCEVRPRNINEMVKKYCDGRDTYKGYKRRNELSFGGINLHFSLIKKKIKTKIDSKDR